MNIFTLWCSVSIIIAGSALSVACKPRDFNKGKTKAVRVDKFRSEGIVIIDWTCVGVRELDKQGSNLQGEFCEWTRTPQTIGNRKVCMFTTAFDQSRKHHLTKSKPRAAEKFEKKSDLFWNTQFNSYALLAGDAENDPGKEFPGLIRHCLDGQKCNTAQCNPVRVSHPEMCHAFQFLGKKRCKVDLEHKVAPVVTALAQTNEADGDKPLKFQLAMSQRASKFCTYEVDPELQKNRPGEVKADQERTLVKCDLYESGQKSCDDIAAELKVEATFKVPNPKCIDE